MQVTWIQITATLDADYSHFCMQITADSAADYSHLWTHISAMMQITATLPKAQNYKSSKAPSRLLLVMMRISATSDADYSHLDTDYCHP